MAKSDRWIQGATDPRKKGALHRQLGMNPDNNIPVHILREVMRKDVGQKINGNTITPLMKKRANFALNVRRPR